MIQCNRCKADLTKLVDESLRMFDNTMTMGYYDVSGGLWKTYARPGETHLCDYCMWADPGYIRDFCDWREKPEHKLTPDGFCAHCDAYAATWLSDCTNPIHTNKVKHG